MNDRKYRVLVVCTGNMCRSPMAEGLLAKLLDGELRERIDVSSAGTSTIDGYGASPYSIMICKEKGIDIFDHKTRELSPDIAARSDLILACDRGHKEFVTRRFEGAAEKTFLLSEFATSGEDSSSIEDPVNCSEEVYRDCFDAIKRYAEKIPPLLEAKLRDRTADE